MDTSTLKVRVHNYIKVDGATYLAQQPREIERCAGCVAAYEHHFNGLCRALRRTCVNKTGSHQYTYIVASVLKSSNGRKN